MNEPIEKLLINKEKVMHETIKYNNTILAIIIRSSFNKDGIDFFTPDNFSQQLGYMNHPTGYIIPPHCHNVISREILHTQEVLFIKSGKVRIDLYNDKKIYIESRILQKGDVILLAFGGHGFEMIEKSEILEVKQGPYCGEKDKNRFNPVNKNELIIK